MMDDQVLVENLDFDNEEKNGYYHDVNLGKVTLEDTARHKFTFVSVDGGSVVPVSVKLNKVGVAQPKLTGIAIKTAPAKLEYHEGDPVDLTGLELTLTYSDGSTGTVAYTEDTKADFTVTGDLEVGTTSVTVTYAGFTAEITGLTVTEDPLKVMLEEVKDLSNDNVEFSDEERLEEIREALATMKDEDTTLTPEEKVQISQTLDVIDDALETLDQTRAVMEQIEDLPETVEPDEEEDILLVEAARRAYNGLTKHQKELVGDDILKKLKELEHDLTDYKIIKGAGTKWKYDGGSLSFTANGPFSKFEEVKIDGKTLATTKYTAKSGSTIITLKESYLETLKSGKHTVTVVFEDGETSAEFTVKAKAGTGSAATGDTSNIIVWIVLFLLCMAALVLLILKGKAKKRK